MNARDPINSVEPGTVAPRGEAVAPIPFERVPLTPLPEVREGNGIDIWWSWDRAWEQWTGDGA